VRPKNPTVTHAITRTTNGSDKDERHMHAPYSP
jgi:hypothetical protein